MAIGSDHGVADAVSAHLVIGNVFAVGRFETLNMESKGFCLALNRRPPLLVAIQINDVNRGNIRAFMSCEPIDDHAYDHTYGHCHPDVFLRHFDHPTYGWPIYLKNLYVSDIYTMKTLEEAAQVYSMTDSVEKHKSIYNAFDVAAKGDNELSTTYQTCQGFGDLAFVWNWKLLVDVMPTNFSMLEIGVYKGRVLAEVGLCARRTGRTAKLHGVTPLYNLGDKYSYYAESNYMSDIHENFDICQVPTTSLQLFIGLSQDPKIHKKVEAAGPYDLIFVDGCHDYDVVVQDIDTYLPQLKVGGYFVMDDCALYVSEEYGPFRGYPDVSRAADERLNNNPHVQHLYAVGHNRVWKKIA